MIKHTHTHTPRKHGHQHSTIHHAPIQTTVAKGNGFENSLHGKNGAGYCSETNAHEVLLKSWFPARLRIISLWLSPYWFSTLVQLLTQIRLLVIHGEKRVTPNRPHPLISSVCLHVVSHVCSLSQPLNTSACTLTRLHACVCIRGTPLSPPAPATSAHHRMWPDPQPAGWKVC